MARHRKLSAMSSDLGRTGRAHRYKFLRSPRPLPPPLPRGSGPPCLGAGLSRERGPLCVMGEQKPVPMGSPHAAPTWPGSGTEGENSDERRAGSGENPTGCAAKRARKKPKENHSLQTAQFHAHKHPQSHRPAPRPCLAVRESPRGVHRYARPRRATKIAELEIAKLELRSFARTSVESPRGGSFSLRTFRCAPGRVFPTACSFLIAVFPVTAVPWPG